MTQFKLSHSIRATQQRSAPYIDAVLKEFAAQWVAKYQGLNPDRTIKRIAFTKQDSRGAPSITLFDDRHCVPSQRHFESYAAMMNFIEGFNAYQRNYI